jgi:hypothetical protein
MAYVTAALQYLLLNGDIIYEDIRNDERWKYSWRDQNQARDRKWSEA